MDNSDPQIDPESSSGLVQSSVALKAQSWFHEVTELRERAMEYRRRARGTHFSREHLAQLYAQQAKLWDSVSSTHQSESESSIAALSLEGTPTSVMNTPTSVEATPRSTQSEPPTTPRYDKNMRNKLFTLIITQIFIDQGNCMVCCDTLQLFVYYCSFQEL